MASGSISLVFLHSSLSIIRAAGCEPDFSINCDPGRSTYLDGASKRDAHAASC